MIHNIPFFFFFSFSFPFPISFPSNWSLCINWYWLLVKEKLPFVPDGDGIARFGDERKENVKRRAAEILFYAYKRFSVAILHY